MFFDGNPCDRGKAAQWINRGRDSEKRDAPEEHRKERAYPFCELYVDVQQRRAFGRFAAHDQGFTFHRQRAGRSKHIRFMAQ